MCIRDRNSVGPILIARVVSGYKIVYTSPYSDSRLAIHRGSADEALHVGGRAKIDTIDTYNSATELLVNNGGVISKMAISSLPTETDPIFTGHTVYNIANGTGFLKNNGSGVWSYDNSTYLTTETDPTVPAHVKSITTTNISNWNTAFSWGNHAGLYVPLTRTITINGTTYDLSANRTWTISTSYTETDPIFTGHTVYNLSLIHI